ncbi:hypothetical protein LUZ63_003326 [Rhynchospora breviuscula]|uniref:Uncharacterized protein n=1 Tax=Rhynchospora breviuscula TaxID=2022672 RepID=A0A9Q0D0G5_9POAL|nr:hypothetical protein LUZ63_003326 [Rhynchospora breviuscula]
MVMVTPSTIAPLLSLTRTPPIPKIINHNSSRTISTHTSRRNISLSAQSNGGNGNGNGNGANGNGGGGGGLDERRRSPLIDLRRWRDLLSADPENIAAVGLTGLLAWASVQALFQLIFISLAIVLAALKYSFIAALLLFILITLL